MQNRWVCAFAPQPSARLRLLCFPYAGGGTSIYRSWSAQLPPYIELCAIRMPGREGRFAEPPQRRMDRLLALLIDGVLPYLDRPVAFFGHSLGALVAFELARALRRESLPTPVHVFVSGRRAPQLPDAREPDEPALYTLPDAELIAELRQLGSAPGEALATPELLDLMLPTVRADLELAETHEYQDGPPLDCPITAFGGLEDEAVTEESIAAWHVHTRHRFALNMLPGDHFFLHAMAGPILAAVVRDLAIGSRMRALP
jgi:medium-chain acyl-[acyl-carrier-protein] hydrolase